MSELRTYLSDTAQRELDALRAALDARLMALEKALAHPDPTESLEALIIDLARVASDEAHASAARKWLEAQASADAQAPVAPAGDGGAGIHGALIEEAATLRREVEQLRARIAHDAERGDNLRRDTEAAHAALNQERGTAQDREAEAVELRAVNQDLREAVETLRGDLDAARKRLADAMTEKQTASAREAEAGRATAALQARASELERALDAARDDIRAAEARAADFESRAAQMEARAAEFESRASAFESRAAELASRAEEFESRAAESVSRGEAAAQAAAAAEAARTRDAEGNLAAERERAAAAERALRDELTALRDQLATAATDRSAAVTDADALRAAHGAVSADLAAANDREKQAAAGSVAAREQAAAAEAELVSARAVFEAARQEATAALAAATARIRELELQAFRREQAAAETTEVDLGAMLEERTPSGDRPIRRYSRYSFRSEMAVDIAGMFARLVDLSVGGAQVLSEAPLELHQETAVSLMSDEIPVSGRGRVMWTRADPQSKGRSLRYRAGIQFTDVDPAAVEAFIIRYSST